MNDQVIDAGGVPRTKIGEVEQLALKALPDCRTQANRRLRPWLGQPTHGVNARHLPTKAPLRSPAP